MSDRQDDIKVVRQTNQTLKVGIGTGAIAKSGGSPHALGNITVSREVSKPPTRKPAC